MRTKIFASLMVIGLAACTSSSTVQTPGALSEGDFANDPTLLLQPGQIAVSFMEAKDSTSSDAADTDTLGVDEIPFVIYEAATNAYGLDPDDTGGTIERVELKNASGSVLLTLTPSSPIAAVDLAPGKYKLVLYSGFTVDQEPTGKSQPMFFQPTAPLNSARSRRAASTGPLTAHWFFFKHKFCQGCDISGQPFDAADLVEAVLANAILVESSFAGTNLTRAKLHLANLSQANLERAKLNYAVLPGANLTDARLVGADLTGAIVDGAIWDRAILDGATWTDGRICAQGSIGYCK